VRSLRNSDQQMVKEGHNGFAGVFGIRDFAFRDHALSSAMKRFFFIQNLPFQQDFAV
jgi:hypothetical protein